jgi:hypothetical protein
MWVYYGLYVINDDGADDDDKMIIVLMCIMKKLNLYFTYLSKINEIFKIKQIFLIVTNRQKEG